MVVVEPLRRGPGTVDFILSHALSSRRDGVRLQRSGQIDGRLWRG
jgi:hypothetical protein